MAKKTSPVQGFDPTKLTQLLAAAGEFAPAVLAFLQRFTDILQSRQATFAGARAVPSAHAHGCTQKAIDHTAAALVELLALQECCEPDEEEYERSRAGTQAGQSVAAEAAKTPSASPPPPPPKGA